MAGMTDTAFRRLVKRHGGCGLVVTEMVSSEGMVRGIDRTLEYAENTEEERPISIQVFGGDPGTMASAAQIVEGMGADIVDVNMGCPVPKIAKHHAGCSLMREPHHAAQVIAAMTRAVKIPVTVKMRAGWNDEDRNAPTLARMVEDAGAAAVAVHGRTAEQSYSGSADWDLVARIADQLTIPVFGSGDCLEPEQVMNRLRSGVDGVLVGRGVLRSELDGGACNECKTSTIGASFAINAASKQKKLAAEFLDAMSTPEMGKMWIETVYLQTGIKADVKNFTGPHAAYFTELMERQKGSKYFVGQPRDMVTGACKDAFGQVLNSGFPGGLLSVDQTVEAMNKACYKG